ncbi:hypothetical protein D3C78_567160 [compost metagenome]
MQTAALTPGEVLDELLLVATFEVEAANVGTRRNLVGADTQLVGTIGDLLEHGLAAVQVFTALVNTGQLHGFTDLDAARVRLFLAHQHAEQGRLTGTVTTDHADDGTFRHGERQVVDQHAVAITFGNVLELDDLVTQARTGRDVDLVGFAALLEFLRLHFFKALQTGLGFGLAGLGAFAHPLQFLFHGLLVGALLLGFLRQTVRLGLQPARVVAFVRDAGAAVQFQDPAGNVVEEVTVVGNRYHGAREVVQEALQPGHRVGVQVVGRFVQQQHVGRRQQQAAQRHAALLATGEVLDLRFPGRQAQGVGGDFQLTLEVVAVAGLEDGFELGLFGGELVEVGIRLGVGSVDLVQARLGVLDHADRFLDHFTHGLGWVQLRFLWQVTHVDVGHRTGFAVEFLVDARHDPQQGRFTGAVQAEHADLGAREERQGNVLENFPLRRHDLAQPMHGVDVLSQNQAL